jgi:hypothetical protein
MGLRVAISFPSSESRDAGAWVSKKRPAIAAGVCSSESTSKCVCSRQPLMESWFQVGGASDHR